MFDIPIDNIYTFVLFFDVNYALEITIPVKMYIFLKETS